MWLRRSRICLQRKRPGFDLWVRNLPWRREWQPTPLFLPGESHEQRSLAGCIQSMRLQESQTWKQLNNNIRGLVKMFIIFSLHTVLTRKNKIQSIRDDTSNACKKYLVSKISFFEKIIYFWLCWVSVALPGLSLVAANSGSFCCRARASHCGGFSCCGAQALGAWAQ